MMEENKKSPERLEILEKINEYEMNGWFDKDVEDDPSSEVLHADSVDYLNSKIRNKLKSKLAFFTAHRFINRLMRKDQFVIKNIIGMENFNNLTTGAIITCNHFNALDSFAMQLTYEASKHKKRRKFYRIIREGNYTSFSGFYGFLMRHCNTLPLSSSTKTMVKFLAATKKILNRGDFILIYPEESMWWNYRKPKPLKNGAFHFAVKNMVPVLPCFITMEDSDVCDKDGFNVQEYTINIGKPIYPEEGKKVSENILNMKNANYELWKDIYENTYHQKLDYLCSYDHTPEE